MLPRVQSAHDHYRRSTLLTVPCHLSSASLDWLDSHANRLSSSGQLNFAAALALCSLSPPLYIAQYCACSESWLYTYLTRS